MPLKDDQERGIAVGLVGVALECSQALISPFTGRPGGHQCTNVHYIRGPPMYISYDIPGGVRN